MTKINLFDKSFVPFIPNEKIENAIDNVAKKINLKHTDDSSPLILLCVLKGSLMFTGELMKRLNFPCELRCIKLSSYEGTESCGEIHQDMELEGSIEGRNVLVVEDIIDTGNTICFLEKLLKKKGAANIEICTMLLKPESYKDNIKIDYIAMEIPNRFIVGFGLDYDQLGRNLKDIYVLDE